MNSRLTFLTPIKLSIPYAVYDTLFRDSYYFGFTKNDTANINGFLNVLIPKLVDYRNDLHLSILDNNNNNSKIAELIEENIYKLYFNKFDFCDNGNVNISLRIGKNNYNKFIQIHDVISSRYNMDFTSFIRSLLVEYSNQRIFKREFLYYFNEVLTIKTAILEKRYCTFYTSEEKHYFIPLSIEQSPNNNKNFIVGYNTTDETCMVTPLSSIQQVIPSDHIGEYDEEDCAFAQDCIDDYFSEEEYICSD